MFSKKKKKYNAMTISHEKHFKPSNNKHRTTNTIQKVSMIVVGTSPIIAGTFNNEKIHCSIHFIYFLFTRRFLKSPLLSFIIIFGKFILKNFTFCISHAIYTGRLFEQYIQVPLRLFMNPMDLCV